jgi:protein-L-isoaspartate O-methyltransferase
VELPRSPIWTLTHLPVPDVIYVNAGAIRPADSWLDGLRDGGRLILPLAATQFQLAMYVAARSFGSNVTAMSFTPLDFASRDLRAPDGGLAYD